MAQGKDLVSLKVNFDVRQLKELATVSMDPKLVEKALRMVAAQYMAQQRGRIELGMEPSGQEFREYDPGYLDLKERAGRTATGWLRLTGQMLKSQQVVVQYGDKARGMIMVIEFVGTRPTAEFRNTSKAAARKRVRRNQSARGGQVGDRLTVVPGDAMVSNAVLAKRNDELRPFIGISPAEAEELAVVFIQALQKEVLFRQLKKLGFKGSKLSAG